MYAVRLWASAFDGYVNNRGIKRGFRQPDRNTVLASGTRPLVFLLSSDSSTAREIDAAETRNGQRRLPEFPKF